MRLPYTHIVKASDERPVRKDGTCFYCNARVGEMHKEGCVILSRSVVIRVEVDVVVEVPEDWSEDIIDYHYNERCRCQSTLLSDIGCWAESRAGCGEIVEVVSLLREATLEDHSTLPVLSEPRIFPEEATKQT